MKTHSYIMVAFLVSLNIFSLQAQNVGEAVFSNTGLIRNKASSSPLLNLRLMEINVSHNDSGQFIGKVIGSPYENEEFIKAQIYYEDEMEGNLFVRYNVINSEVEIKENLSEENPKRLLADKNIKIKLPDKELLFSTFITKKGETTNGYLSKILDGDTYKLYHRAVGKYSEGQAAANSMVNPKPARYVHFSEFYFMEEEKNRIDEIITNKRRFIKQLNPEIRDKAKNFISENKIDLDNREDLLLVFNYLNKED